MPRTAESLALELYARGFTTSRDEARDLVRTHRYGVELLSKPKDREMRHGDDKAHQSEWGGVGFE